MEWIFATDALGCGTALYAGDDETDESVFSHPAVAGIRVGEPGQSRARFSLRNQEEIDGLLARLVELRARPRLRAPERRRAR